MLLHIKPKYARWSWPTSTSFRSCCSKSSASRPTWGKRVQNSFQVLWDWRPLSELSSSVLPWEALWSRCRESPPLASAHSCSWRQAGRPPPGRAARLPWRGLSCRRTSDSLQGWTSGSSRRISPLAAVPPLLPACLNLLCLYYTEWLDAIGANNRNIFVTQFSSLSCPTSP